MLTNPFEEAQARFAELTKVMEEADKIRPEWIELQDWLTKSRKLFPKYFETVNGNNHHEETVEEKNAFAEPADTGKRHRNPTSKMAIEVFKAHGPQPIGQLLIHLCEAGWRGSGDADRDARAVYNALSLHPELFRNMGGGVWNLQRGRP